jgi:hypothetical protein
MPQRISAYARRIESELSDLPDELRNSAYVAANGELAGPREDAKAAARWLVAQGYGILGGEVWEILGNGHWQGRIRSATGPIPFVWGWETEPGWDEAEPWSTDVKRGLEQAIEALERGLSGSEAAIEIVPRLRYNLTYSRQNAFPHGKG